MCKENGLEPSKTYSGKFRVRMDPGLHRQVANAAALAGKTLNACENDTLRQASEGGE